MQKFKFEPDILPSTKVFKTQEICFTINRTGIIVILDISKVQCQIPITIIVDDPVKEFIFK